MANNDSEDLVSQIKVTGGPAATAEIQTFADKGSAAFDKLNRSASASAGGIASSAASVEAGAKKAATGLTAIGNAPIGAQLVGNIKNIEGAISSLTQKLPQLTQAVGRFTQRFALVGAAAAAGAIGLATAARNIAKQVDGESDSFAKLTQSQIDSNNSQLSGQIAAINHASAIRQLSAQLAAGKITYSQYNDAIKQSNADFAEQQRVAAEVEIAQRNVKEENDRLTKSLADRTAMNKLIDTFGGPLLSSLITFGRQVESVRAQFITAFSPSLASGIDLISNVLNRNATAISSFFKTAADKLQNLFKTSGPEIERTIERLGSAFGAVFNGLIDAAPGILDFFNNRLAPAVEKVIGLFGSLATAINSVFGTNLTGGSIILITILAQMTGSIKLLLTVMRAGGAIFKGFISLLEAVGVGIAEAFGAKKVAQIFKIGAAVSKGGGPIKTFLSLIRTAIPLVTLLAETIAVALGVSFGTAAVLVAALTAALIFLLTKVDWKKFAADAADAVKSIITFFGNLPANLTEIFRRVWVGAQILAARAATNIVAAWDATVTFFTDTLPNAISTALDALWQGIVTLASATADGIVTAWNAVVAFFQQLPTTIPAFFASLWLLVTTGVGVAVQFVIDKWNSVVSFFQGLPGTLQSVWDSISSAIVSAFQTAIDRVTTFFSDLLAAATAKLQPIIDILKAIINLASSASSAEASAANGGQFAGGGRVRGPGSATSDSIPAWLSNGEFVMRARAVAKYGSAFMHAINSGQLNLPRLALGGFPMIAASPGRSHFADGGAAHASGRPMTLVIGGQTFEGLTAPDDVASRLSKFAIGKQSRSAGRKSSWVGGR